GAHQAGIVTPPPDRLMFAAFDLTIATAGELRELLQVWTEAAARMTAGHPAGPPGRALDAAPKDTGEALGLPPSSLTVTFGLGARRPRPLAPLGPLPGDRLDPSRSGGDLCIQACADDPQVAFHAVRNL